MGIDTLRNIILTRYPDLVKSAFPDNPDGDGALAYALYLFLRTTPEVTLSVDDWKMIKFVSESSDSLRAVGIIYVLPNDELPVDVELTMNGDSIDYKLIFGASDGNWESLSDSKRWKAVYLYATAESEENWTWLEPIIGSRFLGDSP